ncbi:hypothetical protein Celaphus_00002008 [Cervus elaphus hippelaphus]|uniref:Uncharacterized protein n=1 Tax=Cervus elaphus hippelaphus TaxID=46360 RepID=A0A212CG10_CEREH|nr:hypothetical protein Celaphus_00002008 [Cervus elaphus hippelaphus]
MEGETQTQVSTSYGAALHSMSMSKNREEGERSPEGYVSQVSRPLKLLTVSQLSQLGPAPSFRKCNPFSQK